VLCVGVGKVVHVNVKVSGYEKMMRGGGGK